MRAILLRQPLVLAYLLSRGIRTPLQHFLEQRREWFFAVLATGEPVVQGAPLDLRQRSGDFDEATTAHEVP